MCLSDSFFQWHSDLSRGMGKKLARYTEVKYLKIVLKMTLCFSQNYKDYFAKYDWSVFTELPIFLRYDTFFHVTILLGAPWVDALSQESTKGTYVGILVRSKAHKRRLSLFSPLQGPTAWPNFLPRSFCLTRAPAKFDAPTAPARVPTGTSTLRIIYIDRISNSIK